jgi:hypothetical protein
MSQANQHKVLNSAIECYLSSVSDSSSEKQSLKNELSNVTLDKLLEDLKETQGKFSEKSRFKKLTDRLKPCITQLNRFSKVGSTFSEV